MKRRRSPKQPASAGDGPPGQDLVLAALTRALLITLVEPEASGSPIFLDQLLQALRLHLQERYGDPVERPAS